MKLQLIRPNFFSPKKFFGLVYLYYNFFGQRSKKFFRQPEKLLIKGNKLDEASTYRWVIIDESFFL